MLFFVIRFYILIIHTGIYIDTSTVVKKRPDNQYMIYMYIVNVSMAAPGEIAIYN